MKKNLLLTVYLVSLLFFISCLNSPDNVTDTGSSGSETTNGFVRRSDGTPVSGAKVYVRPLDFLADTSTVGQEIEPDAVSDEKGYYQIDSLSAGEYFVEIVGESDSSALISFTRYTEIGNNLGDITIKPGIRIQGAIDRSNMDDQINVYVQMYGLRRVERTDQEGQFIFRGMPTGNFKLKITSSLLDFGIIDDEEVFVDEDYPFYEGENFTFDAGHYIFPSEYWRDTAVVRELLDVNGLDTVDIWSVAQEYQGRIVSLDLEQLNLTQIPGSIGELRLEELILDGNVISTLPEEFGNITTLVSLSLIGNQLTSLPASFTSLHNLEYLDLGFNDLPSLPENIGDLWKLSILALDYNTLTLLPESIGNLYNLVELNIEGNQLTTLPVSFMNLEYLNFLNISENSLCSLPEELDAWVETYSSNPHWFESQNCLP